MPLSQPRFAFAKITVIVAVKRTCMNGSHCPEAARLAFAPQILD